MFCNARVLPTHQSCSDIVEVFRHSRISFKVQRLVCIPPDRPALSRRLLGWIGSEVTPRFFSSASRSARYQRTRCALARTQVPAHASARAPRASAAPAAGGLREQEGSVVDSCACCGEGCATSTGICALVFFAPDQSHRYDDEIDGSVRIYGSHEHTG